jgi:hypothetical protein
MIKRVLCSTLVVLSSLAAAVPCLAQGDEPAAAAAAPAPEYNGADIAWMLTSSALVLMMTAPDCHPRGLSGKDPQGRCVF